MTEREWLDILERASRDVKGIVHSQRVLDEINDTLGRRRPLEEDFIFREAFGHNPEEPRVIRIDGVEITIRILHRRGLNQSDIKGADLLYEIAGRKFILIQYKSVGPRGRVSKDTRQLESLIGACPNTCPPWSPDKFVTCGSWYSVHSTEESLYLPACFAADLFGDAGSSPVSRFSRGLSAETFQHLFARCWTGVRIALTDIASLTWSALENDRVLFSIVQRGTFGR